MSESTPALPPPSADKTVEQARAEFRDDIRRLNIYHPIVGWSINSMTGAIVLICGCDDRPRETTASNHHWVEAVRKARGPQRKR